MALARFGWFLVAGVSLVGCGVAMDRDESTQTQALSAGGGACKFTAHLIGAEEAPVPVETNATGQAKFWLDDDGTTLHYKLIASNIDNVTAAHIHKAPVGVAAPPVVTLVGNLAAGGGPQNGVLAEGEIDLTPYPTLLADMASGGTYVNVHTNDGVGAISTGPGDFPAGEIRGQIRMIGSGCP